MEPPSRNRIAVLDKSGRRLRIQPLRRAIEATLSQHGALDFEVTLLLTEDEHVRALNKQFRGLEEDTDVLTFPAPEQDPRTRIRGDIAIAVPYADRQAHARRIPLSDELAYLAIHGTLHLLGFDDETTEDREAMHREMSQIGNLLNLSPEPEWSSLLHGGSK